MRSPTRADLGCLVCIVVAAALMHGHGLLRGRVLLPADIVPLMRPYAADARARFPDFRFAQNQMLGPIFEYYSWRYAARERMRNGEIPLWNDMEMSGNVLLANSQSAVLYPPNVLLYLLPLWLGINLVTVFHTVATGLLMYGLLRSLCLAPIASLTGALAWMLCGPMLVWTEFQTPTAVLCWLPGCLWAVETMADGRKVGAGLIAGSVSLALSLTAGHPQFAFYVVLAALLFAAWRLGRRVIRAASAMVALAFLLSAATLLPVTEASRINHRARASSFAESVRLRLPPGYLAMFVTPNVLGNPRDYVSLEDGVPRPGHPYVGTYDFIEYCPYAGVATLVLAALAVLRWFSSRHVRAMSVLGTLGLALALGTPLGAVFYHLVPGYAQFYAPARAVCLAVFALCVLAAHGAQLLLEIGADPKASRTLLRSMSATAAVFAATAIASWPLLARQFPSIISPDWVAYEASNIRHVVLVAALTVAAGAGLLVPVPTPWRRASAAALPLLVGLDLLLWGSGFNPATDAEMLQLRSMTTERLRSVSPARVLSLETPALGIKSMVVPNYNVVAGYREVQGADSVHSLRYHHAMAAVARAMSPTWRAFPDNNTIRLPGADHRILDALNVAWVTTCPPASLPADRFIRDSEEELTVWRNPRACGPAWVVSRVMTVDSPEDAVRLFSREGMNPRRLATVEGAPLRVDARAAGTVALTHCSAHRLRYRVETTAPALMVTSEPAYPGWKATLWHNGSARTVPIRIADGLLRAAVVPAGTSRVEMHYEPASFLVGLYVTCLALGVVAAMLVGCTVRKIPVK